MLYELCWHISFVCTCMCVCVCMFVCSVCMCVCMCIVFMLYDVFIFVCAQTCVYYVSGGQRFMLNAFSYHSTLVFEMDSLTLNLELTN